MFKQLAIAVKNYLAPVDSRGWYPLIHEPFGGAWQENEEWRIDSVLAFHAVFACITLIASDISKLKINIVEKDTNGIWQIIKDTKYDNLLKKPNHYQNRIQFLESWIISKLSKGNTYGLKIRGANGIVEKILVLDPCKIQVLCAPDGSVIYKAQPDKLNGIDQNSLHIPASEIIHDRWNCLFHPLVGISPLFASGLAASHGISIQTDSKTFFSNHAIPSGILTAPGPISKETADRLKADWNVKYSGLNSGKVAVVGDGLKFEAMRMTAEDSQLIEQLKYSAENVCSTFHVPPYKIGVGAMPTHDNIDALTQDYYSQCLQILIESFESCFDFGLDISNGQRIELDLNSLFRMDTKKQIETFAAGVKGSLYAPNEARAKLNLKPLPGGDSVFMQQQNYSLEALARRDAQDNPFATSTSATNMPQDDSSNEADQSNALTDDTKLLIKYIFSEDLAKCLPTI